MDWLSKLDERQAKEIRFACKYVNEFNHGTSGHLSLNVIAKLADIISDMLDILETDYDMDINEFMQDVLDD